MSEPNTQAEVLFVSHGGGPLPLLGDPGHREMVDCLKKLSGTLRRPSAILVVSAHWEERCPTITAGANPQLIYDYYGFPEESYSIQYPCPGEPALAATVHKALSEAGIESTMDGERGFDHGLFVPLKLLFPQAEIPCIQLSLNNNLDAAEHLKIGEALRALQWQDLLIVGSGFSFHNMREFFAPESEQARSLNREFEQWLHETCTSASIDENTRAKRFIQWEAAPGARFCHPREEHLLPLYVCYGVAGAPATQAYTLNILNKRASMYWWRPQIGWPDIYRP